MEQSLESFGSWFRELYHLDNPDVREYSALTLAYIGDAVYEIIIRTYIVGKGQCAWWNVFTNVPAALSKQKHRPI